MATLGQWYNADGLQVRFGQYFANPANKVNRPLGLNTLGRTRQVEVYFDLTQIPTGTVSYTTDTNNDGTLDAFNEGDLAIPANASITKAVIVMSAGATGGTSIVVGTYTQNGTAVSANSVVTATEGAIANIATTGYRIYGAGALVSTSAGTAGVGTDDVYIGIKTSGTFTAGTGTLVIEYIDPNPDANVQNT